jgi:iron complex transport system substrate-binding protein
MNRVLSLLPSATEIIYEIGAGDLLIGVTHECDYPRQAGSMPRVTSAKIDPSMESATIDAMVRQQLDDSGTLYALDMDLLRRLRPDLVLTQQLCTVCAVGYETVHAAMRSLPEPPRVVNLEPNTLDDVLGTIVDVGEMLGLRGRAIERVGALRERLAAIPRIPAAPRVLFLEWLIPPFSGGHWMPELVEAAGGVPVLANSGAYSRQISWETIAAAGFDVIVVSCCGFSAERGMRDLAASDELRRLLAGRPGLRLILFDGNHFFSRPGPRLVESAELLNRALRGIPPSEAGASIPDPYREPALDEIASFARAAEATRSGG